MSHGPACVEHGCRTLCRGVYVARYLGPERFGLLSYAGSFVGLFTALATIGLDGIMVRKLVKNLKRRDELLGAAFRLKADGAVMLWLGVAASILFSNIVFP